MQRVPGLAARGGPPQHSAAQHGHSTAPTLAASYSARSGLIFSVRRSYAAARLAWLNCSLRAGSRGGQQGQRDEVGLEECAAARQPAN